METVEKRFFGRERLLREIVSGVGAPQPASFCLVGPKFIGKTSILERLAAADGPLLDDERARDHIVVARLDCGMHGAESDVLAAIAASFVEQLRGRELPDFDWDQIDAQPTSARRTWQISQQLTASGRRLALLMDNFDAVFQGQILPETAEELRPLTRNAAVIVAAEQPLHDLDRELVAAPFYEAMTQLFIGLIEPAAAEQWVAACCREYPELSPVCADLLEMTGAHPYLLHRLSDILAEVQAMLTPQQRLGPKHLPLIRLRLSEHGQLLFVTIWHGLQTPPHRVHFRVVMRLLERLLASPLPIDELASDQLAALNWLINQAVVVYGGQGYRLFSPLFAEFLGARIRGATNAPRSSATGDESPFPSGLTKTEGALLRYFQAHANTVIPSEQLLADVWNRPDATPRRVQEAIRRLRLRLDEAVPPVGVIENERGRGYRFVPAEI